MSTHQLKNEIMMTAQNRNANQNIISLQQLYFNKNMVHANVLSLNIIVIRKANLRPSIEGNGNNYMYIKQLEIYRITRAEKNEKGRKKGKTAAER